MNVSFRLATEADLDIIDDILVTAYKFSGSRKEMLSTYYLSVQTDGWWLALIDGKPVGFGGAVDYGTFCSAGMLCVYPEWQRHGIGEAFGRHIVASCEARGCPTIICEARPEVAHLYKRFGVLEEGTTPQMVLDELPAGLPSFPGVTHLQAEDIPAVAAFDARYFGGDRTKILVSHFQAHPESVFVTRDELGQITGYLFARSGVLGPWVASNVGDAERLLVQALSLPFERTPGLSIPAANEAGIALLKRYQFREREQDIFMRYGAPYPGQRAMIYAQASPALG
jgi:predicted N-acetyltransferase YhbS